MASERQQKDKLKPFGDRWNYPPVEKPTKIKYIACGENAIYGEKNTYTPCWKSPGTTADVRFGPCWDYAPKRFKSSPPAKPCRGAIPLKSLKPNFDSCETLYTRCDFQLEECVHQQILVIEGILRNLESQLTSSKEQQIEWATQMRYQAIRRRLLIGSACGIKIYPEYLSQMAEQRSLCEFQKGYDDINASNFELTDQILLLRNAIGELGIRLDRLDRTIESPFILGLKTVLRTIQDLYDYFFELIRKYKTWAQLIDAGQEHSIDDYLALLQDKQDFESFKRAGTEHCTCKRCRNSNPLDKYLPCWCQGRDRREINTKLVSEDSMDTQRKMSVPDHPVVDSSDTSTTQSQVDKSSDV